MSKRPTKAPGKRARWRERRSFAALQLQYANAGLNPLDGFKVDGPGSIWRLVLGYPLLFGIAATAALLVGFIMGWVPAFIIGVGLWVWVGAWSIAVYAWLKLRGWSSAISEMEKKRRKAYRSKA